MRRFSSVSPSAAPASGLAHVLATNHFHKLFNIKYHLHEIQKPHCAGGPRNRPPPARQRMPVPQDDSEEDPDPVLCGDSEDSEEDKEPEDLDEYGLDWGWD